MKYCRLCCLSAVVISFAAMDASGQVSSLGAKKRIRDTANPPAKATREAPGHQRNLVYERYSWVSVAPKPPKTFKPGDLITIIVRENRSFKGKSQLKTRNQFELLSEIEAFLKLTQGGLGASKFQRGRPEIDYSFEQRVRKKGDLDRTDRFSTRITASILDVKPNGTLVLEAKSRSEHDEEITVVSLTGMCRKEDVTADNTILSTQLATKSLVVQNEGALRTASSRGWLYNLIDKLGPF